MRELLPVGAAAGAAALAVTVVVGGTTAELVSPARQGRWPVATSPQPIDLPVITNAPAPRRATARSGAPGPIAVELAAGPVAVVTGPLARQAAVARRAAVAPRAVGRAMAAPPALGRSVPASEPVAAVAPVAADLVPAPTVSAVEPIFSVAVTSGNDTPSTSRSRAPKRSKVTGGAKAGGTLSAASAGGATDVRSAPAKGDVRGHGRGGGRESAPGQARSAREARLQLR